MAWVGAASLAVATAAAAEADPSAKVCAQAKKARASCQAMVAMSTPIAMNPADTGEKTCDLVFYGCPTARCTQGAAKAKQQVPYRGRTGRVATLDTDMIGVRFAAPCGKVLGLPGLIGSQRGTLEGFCAAAKAKAKTCQALIDATQLQGVLMADDFAGPCRLTFERCGSQVCGTVGAPNRQAVTYLGLTGKVRKIPEGGVHYKLGYVEAQFPESCGTIFRKLLSIRGAKR